ncbi:MAG: hypothetical protein H6738_07695 [Alphaproteobacteria bacterium]|nr:hypothetical protein [Alphaproteobacteria bacterium]MCB9696648.1 hypothetical protein [Alphaproteobacteria bacterium]
MRAALVASVLALGGCGPVSGGGSVDGERFGGGQSAIFDRFDFDFFGVDWEQTTIFLTDIPDACNTMEDMAEAFTDANDCDDLCDNYQDVAEKRHLVSRRYWTMSVVVNTSDDREGSFDFDRDLADGDFVADFSWLDGEQAFDRDLCENACEDDDFDDDSEDGEDGDLEILQHDSDLLEGDMQVDFGGDDSANMHFTADRCDMTDWLF